MRAQLGHAGFRPTNNAQRPLKASLQGSKKAPRLESLSRRHPLARARRRNSAEKSALERRRSHAWASARSNLGDAGLAGLGSSTQSMTLGCLGFALSRCF